LAPLPAAFLADVDTEPGDHLDGVAAGFFAVFGIALMPK
jgi:hypothetical protein